MSTKKVGFRKTTPAADAEKMRRITADIQASPGTLAELLAQAPEVSPVKVQAAAAGPQYLVGNIYEVPISALTPNPLNPRPRPGQQSLVELADSILKNSQEDVATAYVERATGRLMLLDGHRRYRASQIAQRSTLRVEILAEPPNARATYLKARRLNTERHGQSAFDDALALRSLLSQGVYPSQVEYAQDTGQSVATVSKLFAIGGLPESIQAYIADREEIQSLKLLYELHLFCEVAGEEKALALIADQSSALTSAAIERARKREAAGPIQRARSAVRTFTYHGVQGRIQRFDRGGRLEVRVSGLSDEHLSQLEQQMSVWLKAQADSGPAE